MIHHKNILTLLFILSAFANAAAQSADISPERKQSIYYLELGKLRDLSKYISFIGNKNTPYSKATREMDRAEELFAPDAEMGVSSLNRKEIAYYKVRKYFERLI